MLSAHLRYGYQVGTVPLDAVVSAVDSCHMATHYEHACMHE